MKASFSCTAGAFLYRFICFPNDCEVCFIKYDACVSRYGSFIEIIIDALRASLHFLEYFFISFNSIYSTTIPFRPCIFNRYNICSFGNRDNNWILINVAATKNLIQEPFSDIDIGL